VIIVGIAFVLVSAGTDMIETSPTAVVLSADCQLRNVITAGLGGIGCTTYDAGSRAEALAYASRTSIDVVVIDGAQLDAAGRDTIRRLSTDQPQLHILYLVEPGEIETERRTIVAADASLRKPFALGELCNIVSTWLAYRATLEQLTDLSIH
jgi:DNA-binding response OmpR family regulator